MTDLDPQNERARNVIAAIESYSAARERFDDDNPDYSFADCYDALTSAEAERDAALAECERLRAENEKASAVIKRHVGGITESLEKSVLIAERDAAVAKAAGLQTAFDNRTARLEATQADLVACEHERRAAVRDAAEAVARADTAERIIREIVALIDADNMGIGALGDAVRALVESQGDTP